LEDAVLDGEGFEETLDEGFGDEVLGDEALDGVFRDDDLDAIFGDGGVVFDGVAFEGVALAGSILGREEALFEGVDGAGALFSGVLGDDAVFEGANLAVTIFEGATAGGAACSLVGAVWYWPLAICRARSFTLRNMLTGRRWC